MLDEDLSAPRKQRQTAKRIYDRLVEERGFTGSYSTVRRFVAESRRERSSGAGEGFLELEWADGGGALDHVARDLLFLLEGEALGRDVHELRHEVGVVLGVLECLPVGHACALFLLPWGSRALRAVRIPVRINPNGAFPSVTKGSARLGQNPSLTCYFVTFCSEA